MSRERYQGREKSGQRRDDSETERIKHFLHGVYRHFGFHAGEDFHNMLRNQIQRQIDHQNSNVPLRMLYTYTAARLQVWAVFHKNRWIPFLYNPEHQLPRAVLPDTCIKVRDMGTDTDITFIPHSISLSAILHPNKPTW